MSGKRKIVVAMSGGVDSSVAAALLQREGHEVVGLFMRNGVKPGPAAAAGKQGCCSLEDSLDARRVADRLDIPFYAVDFAADFGRIMDYFAAEYDAGRTPNPCIQCNRWLKFGKLLDHADSLGFDAVATGHYARVVRRGERITVARAADRDKDQSYVLFPLEQHQLERTVFPLGDLEKKDVRALAEEIGLAVHDKPDSQEICFVPDNDYRGFLKRRHPDSFAAGDMVDVDGEVVGRHEGHQMFTIGQRRGLGRAFGKPTYVVGIDAAQNRVVVGGPDDLLAHGLVIGAPTWSGLAGLTAGESVEGMVKIRYRHAPVAARAALDESGRPVVRFDEEVSAVTPGQAAVFYDGDDVLFGGFIDEVLAPARGAI